MPRKAKEIIVNKKLCKGCHICIAVCPHKVFVKAKTVDNRGFYLPVVERLETCTVCRLCELECPDFAIAVIESD